MEMSYETPCIASLNKKSLCFENRGQEVKTGLAVCWHQWERGGYKKSVRG
jgi:hypothetical protein